MRKCWPYSVIWHSAVIDPDDPMQSAVRATPTGNLLAALAASAGIPDDGWRAKALQGIAEALAKADDIGGAFATARGIPDDVVPPRLRSSSLLKCRWRWYVSPDANPIVTTKPVRTEQAMQNDDQPLPRGNPQDWTMSQLEDFGRIRLSNHFFMRDMLYSEVASIHGLRNVPDTRAGCRGREAALYEASRAPARHVRPCVGQIGIPLGRSQFLWREVRERRRDREKPRAPCLGPA